MCPPWWVTEIFTTDDMFFSYMPKIDKYSVEKVPILYDNIFDISDQKSSTSYKPIQNYCQIISELFLRYTCRVWACSKKPCPRWWKISGTQQGVHTLIWRNFCQLHKCGQNLILQIIENYGTVTWSFWLLLLRWSDDEKKLSWYKKEGMDFF